VAPLDGIPYTTRFPVNYARADSNVEYVLLYSADNGVTCATCRTTRSRRSACCRRRACAWPTRSRARRDVRLEHALRSLPAGTYRVRVEAYRTAAKLHYSFHEERIYINR